MSPQALFYMAARKTSVSGSRDPFLINQEHLRISNFSSNVSSRPHTFVFTYELNSMLSHAFASLTTVILIAILRHWHELLHIFSLREGAGQRSIFFLARKEPSKDRFFPGGEIHGNGLLFSSDKRQGNGRFFC